MNRRVILTKIGGVCGRLDVSFLQALRHIEGAANVWSFEARKPPVCPRAELISKTTRVAFEN